MESEEESFPNNGCFLLVSLNRVTITSSVQSINKRAHSSPAPLTLQIAVSISEKGAPSLQSRRIAYFIFFDSIETEDSPVNSPVNFFIISSLKGISREAGRLSTQKYPVSSRARKALDLPEPESPLSIIKFKLFKLTYKIKI